MNSQDYSAFNLIRLQDIYLVPFWFLIILYLVRLKYISYSNSPVRVYIYPAFLLRAFGALLYTLVINYYYGFGDSHNYYQGALDMHKAVMDDNSFWIDIYSKWKLETIDRIYPYFAFDGTYSTQYYMQEVRTYNVSRLALPFTYIFNKSFLCISLAISYLSFLGGWKLFRMFYELYPHLHRKIAIATLFLPSLLFWSTSLLKDSFCYAALCFLTYSLYSITIKREFVVKEFIIALISAYVLLKLKSYILISMVSVISVWIFLRYKNNIKDRLTRQISTIAFLILAISMGVFTASVFSGIDDATQLKTESLIGTLNATQFNFENTQGIGSGSTFKSAKANSFGDLLLSFPQGVINTYFRPFFWDVRSSIAFFSALEAFAFLALLYICIKKIGVRPFLQTVLSEPVIAFCLGFSILFGGVIGLTTTNFGALSRYKIPSISFYVMGIVLVMDKFPFFSNRYLFSSRFI